MKKLLMLLGGLSLSLALLGAGCTNKLEGTWVSDKPLGNQTVELEFTKTRLIATTDLVQTLDANKKSTAKIIVDYKLKNDKEPTMTVTIDNPEANIGGDYETEKTQAQWQEDIKKVLNEQKSYPVIISADGQTMNIVSPDGQTLGFRKQK